jgi:hypothetical protein
VRFIHIMSRIQANMFDASGNESTAGGVLLYSVLTLPDTPSTERIMMLHEVGVRAVLKPFVLRPSTEQLGRAETMAKILQLMGLRNGGLEGKLLRTIGEEGQYLKKALRVVDRYALRVHCHDACHNILQFRGFIRRGYKRRFQEVFRLPANFDRNERKE